MFDLFYDTTILMYWLCSILYDSLLVMYDWRISGKHQIIITKPRIKTFRPHKIWIIIDLLKPSLSNL